MDTLTSLQIIPVPGIPEVQPGDDLAEVIWSTLNRNNLVLQEGDILVIAHKVVSKSEGRLVDLRSVVPSDLARRYAEQYGKDPRHVEVVLRESNRIVRMDRGIIISETRHGFVCANAGVDASNVRGEECVCLLPLDPDASARLIGERLETHTGFHLPVIITDSFGRPWRSGIVNVAIGVYGMSPVADYRGQADIYGRDLVVTVMAIADEIAGAAELVMGKLNAVPVAIVRGYPYEQSEGHAKSLVMPAERDLFR